MLRGGHGFHTDHRQAGGFHFSLRTDNNAVCGLGTFLSEIPVHAVATFYR